MIDLIFYATLALLCATTAWAIWRTRGRLNAGVLIPLAWIVLIPMPVIVRPWTPPTGVFPDGFIGTARNNMYIAIAMANVAFALFQLFLVSRWFAAVQAWIVALLGGRAEARPDESRHPFYRRWLLVVTVVAVGWALFHLALMPRIPAFDLVTGFANPLQPNYDREASDKLLHVNALVRYSFHWNKEVIFPVLFAAAVLLRWRWLAVFIGVFGFFYMVSSLEKFPSQAFVLAPFVAIAVRDKKAMWSPLVIAGVLLSLVGPWAINQAPSISTSVHQSLNLAVAPDTVPASYNTSAITEVPGCTTTQTASATFSTPALVAGILDLVVRRTGLVPAEVTYGWFAYFPAVHPYLKGSGWAPWNVLSSGYRNPSNLVGLWMYCGHAVTLPSVSAYAAFVADGWAEFGFAGVLIACLGIILFGIILELLKAFTNNLMCLACYAPSIVLYATLPPRASVLASILSSGLFLVPLLCFLIVLSERMRARHVPALTLEAAPS